MTNINSNMFQINNVGNIGAKQTKDDSKVETLNEALEDGKLTQDELNRLKDVFITHDAGVNPNKDAYQASEKKFLLNVKSSIGVGAIDLGLDELGIGVDAVDFLKNVSYQSSADAPVEIY